MMKEQTKHEDSRRIWISGGAGFIGSHVANKGVQQGLAVGVYDNFSRGRRDFLVASDNLTVVEGDILDSTSLDATIERFSPDVVYHLAAIHHIPTCEEDPPAALRANVEGTQNVLSACARVGVPRVVFASTGAVYDVADGALGEDHPLRPRDIYGISKICGEHLVRYYTSRHEAQAVIARFFNTVGRHETNAHLIPDIVAQLNAGTRRLELGNLAPRRDYVHVEDVAEALLALGAYEMTDAVETYNIASGQEFSVQDIVDFLAEAIEEPLEAVSVASRRRKVDRPSQLGDVRRIGRTVGWKPKRTLKQALREVWEEQRERSQG